MFFTSDNGPHQEGGADPAFFDSGGGLRGIKRDLYEGGIRVPMIVCWPGRVPAAAASAHVWAHWDLLPTLADLAGAPAPTASMASRCARRSKAVAQRAHEFLYWEFHERGFQQAVRMGKWKALRLKVGAPLELYDLDADRGEARDVAALHPTSSRAPNYLERRKSARTPSWAVGRRR